MASEIINVFPDYDTPLLQDVQQLSPNQLDQLIEDLSSDFEDLPILFRGDKDIQNVYLDRLRQIQLTGKIRFFNFDIRLAISKINDSFADPVHSYSQALASFKALVYQSSEYQELEVTGTQESLDALILKFRPKFTNDGRILNGGSAAPSNLIRSLFGHHVLVPKINLDSVEQYDEARLKSLYDLTLDFNRELRLLPNSPLYPKLMYELAARIFHDHPHALLLILCCHNEPDSGWTYPGLTVLPDMVRFRLNFGFKKFLIPKHRFTNEYSKWLALLVSQLSLSAPDLINSVYSIFESTSFEELSDIPDELKEVVELLALTQVALKTAGAEDWVLDKALYELAPMYLEKSAVFHESFDMPLRKFLWGLFTSKSVQNFTIPESVSKWLISIRNFAERHVLPIKIFNSLSNLMSAIGIGLYNVIDKILEVILGTLVYLTNSTWDTFEEYAYLTRAIASYLLPEARRRPKTVWALFFPSTFTRLTPAERLLLKYRTMAEPIDTSSYREWAEARIAALNQTGLGPEMKYELPVRPAYLPNKPTVADIDLANLVPLLRERDKEIHPGVSAWIASLRERGISPGVSSVWFDATRSLKSIQRYDIERPVASDTLLNLVKETAHALADQFPEMYEDSKFLTPAAAFNKIKIKYSPGLPFIPRFRNRKELQKIGLLDAVVRVAENHMAMGEHPGTAAHCFKKDGLQDLQKLLDGKNIRTVIAQELVGNILAYTATLETTRRQPPSRAWIMNAVPRSEGGFRPFYDKLKTRLTVFQADAKEFDSKIAPVIAVDGIAELRSRGYRGQIIEQKAKAAIRATYVALSHAWLVNLDDGSVVRKTGGFMTGQANTSPDNRDAFRILWIAAWSAVTGKDPRAFWDTNDLGNAGDDDAIATDDDPAILDLIIDFIKQNFGVEIEVETRGFENLSLVGLMPLDVPQSSIKYYHVKGMSVPQYAIASDPEKLLAKRTEFKTSISRFHSLEFLMHHIPTLIGTAYLSCHLPDVYEELASEYESEVTQLFTRFFKKISFIKGRDEDGRLVSIVVNPNQPRDRYIGKVDHLLKWLKSNQFPSYSKVFDIWVKPQDVDNTKMSKDYRKILTWNPAITGQDQVLWGLISSRKFLWDWIPNHVVKVTPEFPGGDPTFAMVNTEYVVAKFVWLSLYHARKKVPPSASLFLTALRENPYATAEDGPGFLNWLTVNKNFTDLLNEDLELHRNRMLAVTFVYWNIETIMHSLTNLPFFSILFNLYALSTRDVNRLYAAANYFYMIATGRSSPIISNLMPPDPFAWIKQFSIIATHILPLRFYRIPGVKHVTSVVPWMTELWAGSATVAAPPLLRQLYKLLPVPETWDTLIANNIHVFDRQPISALVVAPTGTGKSTAFIGALVRSYRLTGTLWVCCPTITARDNYENQFLPNNSYQVLTNGVLNNIQIRVKILTYGHLVYGRRPEVKPGDTVFLDEIHLAEPDMFRAYKFFKDFCNIIGITATPNMTLTPSFIDRIDYPGGRRFKVNVQYVNSDFDQLWTTVSRTSPEHLSRALIVAPTLKEVTKIRHYLSRLSIVSYELSSDNPVANPTGVIVATTIVDTAVTVPNITCLIDLGERIRFTFDYSGVFPTKVASIVPTPPSVHTQRLGRAGRASDSTAYVLSKGGTGEEDNILPSPFDLLSDSETSGYLLVTYKVASVVEKRQGATTGTLLDYVTINTNFIIDSIKPHSIALALYIFIRMSARMTLDDVRYEWMLSRFEKSPYEVVNQLLDLPDRYGYGNPLLGDFHEAESLLLGGLISVSTSLGLIPTTCLGLVGNLIIPCGQIRQYINHDYALRPMNIGFRETIGAQSLSLPDLVAKFTLMPHEPMEEVVVEQHFIRDRLEDLPKIEEQNHQFSLHPQLLHLFSNLRQAFSSVRDIKSVVEFTLQSSPKSTNAQSFDFLLNILPRRRRSHQILCDQFNLNPRISSFAFVLLAACALPDNIIVLYNPSNSEEPKYLTNVLHVGLIYNFEDNWLLVRPAYIRSYIDILYINIRQGYRTNAFHQIPAYRCCNILPGDDWPAQLCRLENRKLRTFERLNTVI